MFSNPSPDTLPAVIGAIGPQGQESVKLEDTIANWKPLVLRPKLSIIICSLNGAADVDRCIRALARQTIRSSVELIVVDDGSTDATSDVGRAHAAIVVRHATNLGLAAARNSGLGAATAPVVAFLDDSCEPEPQWAEQLLVGYEKGVIAVGGPILPGGREGFMLGYLERNNPAKPQELNLAKSNRLVYRLYLYLRRQWTQAEDLSHREVYSFAGANMSFLRQALIQVGQFDERFRFGAEELDLCMRLGRAFPSGRLVFAPTARVVHHYQVSMHDTLHRSRAYGRGSARLYRKWPFVPPTFFPGPLVILAMLLLSTRLPLLAVAAVATPHLLYPKGVRYAIASRSGVSLLDAYVQLAQETCGNIGFLEGLWRFRHLVPEPRTEAVHAVQPREGTTDDSSGVFHR
jgi:GT2 family glycosyltransferase